MLASASNAIISVSTSGPRRGYPYLRKRGVEIKPYDIIYKSSPT